MLNQILDSKNYDKKVAHITQSWEWGEFRENTPSIKKVLRLGDGNKVWQIFFSKVPYFKGKTVAYLPRIIAPTQEELMELKEYCKKENAIFLKIEPLTEMNDGLESKSILPRHTIYIDLTKSEDVLLSEMHEKTRYNIRLAEKKGVTIKMVDNEEGLEKFIDLLESTESRQGFYSHYRNYYFDLWKTLRPKKMVYLLNACVEGEVVAGIMLFHLNDMLYYPYGGSNPKYKEFMAPSLLHFEAIKFGKSLNCKNYDLWGSYRYTPSELDPWWGIYRFKKGFGGKEVTFPSSIDIPLSPLYKPLIFAEKIQWKILKLKRK